MDNLEINFIGDIAFFKEYESLMPFHLLSDKKNLIGNFEFMVPDENEAVYYDIPKEYRFSKRLFTPLPLNLFAAGLANNHCLDYGEKGLENSIAFLQNNSIKTFGVGLKNFNYLVLSENDISVCILACVKRGRWTRRNLNLGPDTYDPNEIEEFICSKKSEFDHIIVFPHWGSELIDVPNPNDVFNAHRFIDAGATAVIGHHPHIIQGIERYKKGLIAYSLGSFLYIPANELGYQNWQKKREYSIVLKLVLSKDEMINYVPMLYQYDFKTKLPKYTESQKAVKYFQKLNRNFDDSVNYYFKKYTILLLREFISFLKRFKTSPKETIKHYFKYLLNMYGR